MARGISIDPTQNPYATPSAKPLDPTRPAGPRTLDPRPLDPNADGPRGISGTPDLPPARTIDPNLEQKNIWQGMKRDATMGYRGQNFGYNPYQQSQAPMLGGMNYNPYRMAATNAAQSSAGQNLVSQQAQLQQSGGMSSADRIRSFSDFNRQKILGQLGGVQRYDQAQSGNYLDTMRGNLERGSSVARTNLAARNDAARDLAQANLRRDQNLYDSATAERNLDRQLDAASIISAAQMRNQGNGGIFGQIFDGLFGG